MSPYSPPELEALIRQRAPEIARDIRAVAESAAIEAELVAAVEPILERFARHFDVSLRHDRERTLINGRADAVYNRFVIEYEPPGSLRKDPAFRTNQHAIDQVRQYMTELERLDRHRKERLAGAVLDGDIFIFVRYRDDLWRVDDPVPVDAESTATFLRYLLSLSTELALTPENLVRDFGENTVVSRQWVSTLYSKLSETKHPRVHTLFEQWQLQFGEITGWESQSGSLGLASIARNFGIREREPDPLRFFYAVHTYYATFIKILAVQIAHYYLLPDQTTSLSESATESGESLHTYLEHLERGGVFAEVGIKNFLEGDFFGWFLDIWDDDIEAIVRRLVGDLGNYSLVTLDVDPEETRDLLKLLYQNLMPRKLRHALGEYYTPDWLAERLINQVGFDGDPNKRVLDPACGSGTFPVLLIKRVRNYALEHNLNPREVLEKITLNIVGYDLNPLAVISARTNYLLALGELLAHRQGDIYIPVYLADSILTPSAGKDLFSHIAYSFNTVVGRFSVPQKLVEPSRIERYAGLLEESVVNGVEPEEFKEHLLRVFSEDELDKSQVYVAIELFDQLRDLEAKGINGIWARIIKNAFAPLFQSKFDLIVGNPPWINWENLPEDYREATIPLWEEHYLFSHKGYRAILGGSKDDISVLLLYIAIDNYLAADGRLGFVITQSVFQTAGAGQGFRRFLLGNGTPLEILHVDDMVKLQPFDGASNRTAVVIIGKGGHTKYPVSYSFWKKKGRFSELSTLQEVLSNTETYQWEGGPVNIDDSTSPWIIGRKSAVHAARKVLGNSKYKGRKGITASINGVFWVQEIGRKEDGNIEVVNLAERSKRDIQSVQVIIEDELVHPLVQGRGVKKWGYEISASLILTHREGQQLKAIPEEEMSTSLPRTYHYLKLFESMLRSSGIYKRFFKASDPFYSIFNIGDYTFAPYKVVFREIASELMSCVIGPDNVKPIIPDHKLVMCPFDSESEAHFVCAVLNSLPVGYAAKSYSIETQYSTHLFDFIGIPTFDNTNRLHMRLADLSREAHILESTGASPEDLEKEIDLLSARLWGLTDREIEDMKQSMTEMKT